MKLNEYKKMYHLESYHWWFRAKRELIRFHVNRSVDNGLLLDVGCGTGILLSEFKDDYECVGTDISSNALNFCKKRGVKRLVSSSAGNLPFRDNSFSAIIASDLIEHLDNDDRVISEFHRILKCGGTLVLTVPAFNFLWTKHDEDFHHKRRYSKGDIVKVLSKNELSISKVTYWNFILSPFITLFKFLYRKCGSNIIPAHKTINSILFSILAIENYLIRFINFPYGISLFVIAKK